MAGDPVYIIRFSGCNLDCCYCDTKYNIEENETLSVSELENIILDQVKKYNNLKILFTGGEPLLNDREDKIIDIINNCPNVEFYIETNGSIEVNSKAPNNCHYISDWKSPSSGEEQSFLDSNIQSLVPGRDCIKFVIDKSDLKWLISKIEIVKDVNPNLQLYVSPQWDGIEFKQLAEFIVKNRLDISLSIQIHKIIWPPELRGV